MGNDTDKRLTELETQLAEMVEQANREIPLFIQQWQTQIDMQRGRIAERKQALEEQSELLDGLGNAPQSNEKAHLSVLPGSQGAILNESQKEA